MTAHASADDFDIAKALFDQLKDLSPERRDRVLRWVAEGLGTALGLAVPGVPASTTRADVAVQPQATVHSPPSQVDIKSFVASKAPKSDQQFAAVVAYYYRFEAPPAQRRENIDGEALQEAARLAGRKRMTNPRFTLNNAKAAGYLDGDSSSGFSVNSVGENLVAMTLPGGSEATATPKRQTKRKTKKGKAKRATKKA